MKPFQLLMPMLVLTINTAVAQDAQVQQAGAIPPGVQQQAPQQMPQQPVLQSQQSAAPAPGQWVQVKGPGTPANFPVPPGQGNSAVNAQMQNAFPQTNYGAGNYTAGAQPQGNAAPLQQGQSQVEQQNGVAPLPPLAAPDDAADFNEAQQIAAPFSPSKIRELRGSLEDTRRAKAYQPVRAIPRITSVSVDLSPGASLPVLRVMPGEISTLVLLDSTGAPWPLAITPRISRDDLFSAEWMAGSHVVVVSTQSSYESGNIALFLQGSTSPVVIKLVTGEPDSTGEKSRIVDARLDVRIPGRGPYAKAPLMGPGKIALYDDTLQAFLDGVPPKDAQAVVAHGDVPTHTKVWQYNGDLFVRTQQDIQTAFDQSLSSGDGTKVYRLPATPFVTLSQMGQSVTLQLDIN
uniref:IncI1 plasmid conjugative transfer protein TraN n=1 Tax=Pseudomonas syringae pv. actinidiae TaxID=103796 RepID=A0A2P0QH04_PSESF|nr:DotH/IcmK family type IV secretion protein [Pseudomonas syringae]ARO44779.1 IncI1 plasmid conjugative transfer protein TraN [Pseudomonas syringae pv. actinidiae]